MQLLPGKVAQQALCKEAQDKLKEEGLGEAEDRIYRKYDSNTR
ncbi:MAG TPA: hypothetical protein VNI77_03700 [Nitrososphaera sp.]|nr:hypothetical protein [Nitrososphaera sp.]